MIYRLTCIQGFGLQFGSDLYLFFVPSAQNKIATVVAQTATAVSYTGTYTMDGIMSNNRSLSGAFTFVNSTNADLVKDIVNGCYRPSSYPWWRQPVAWQAQFVLVPAFATLLALANMQPYWAFDFPIMVVFAICSYLSNKAASRLIFGHSDIVASVGAFVVGILGNGYSRMFGGTAFTVMVPGVLFLVPVSTSICICAREVAADV